jgi:hypothetical protein
MFRALKKFRAILKKEAEISRAQRRLFAMPIDYQALQTIADTVSSGYNVEIIVTTKFGDKIEIKRGSSKEEMPFKTFAERYNDYKNGVR